MLLLCASASVSSPTRFAVAESAGLLGRGRLSGRVLLRLATRHGCASLVAHRDQQRRDVFAVLIGLLEGRTGALRRDAFAAEANGHLVGLRIGAFDLSGGVRFGDSDLLDHLAFLVVEAAQEGAGAEQASEATIGECRKSVC